MRNTLYVLMFFAVGIPYFFGSEIYGINTKPLAVSLFFALFLVRVNLPRIDKPKKKLLEKAENAAAMLQKKQFEM